MIESTHYNPLRGQQSTFEPLTLAIKSEDSQLLGYNVYVDANQYYYVEATTVAEAIVKSNVRNPLKIVPIGLGRKTIFQQDALQELESSYDRFTQKPSSILPPPKPIPIQDTLNN